MSESDWCTIESDPGVFTELLETIGCQSVELQELWSLDDDSLLQLQQSTGHVYGLIFLFQWVGQQQQEHAAQSEPLDEESIPEGLFFAHQITTNACATQAILSVVMNHVAADDSNSDDKTKISKENLGPVLSEFHSFTSSFGPNLKGVAISSSEQIKKAHNAFARPDGFLTADMPKPVVDPDESEAFHFVAYLPYQGIVYELDGLQKGPIVVGACDDDDDDTTKNISATVQPWLAQARTAIQQRMAKAAEGNVKFNLMAVIQDKRILLQQQLDSDGNTEAASLLAMEQAKREQYKAENQRRRHNYVPLCVQMLKELARLKALPELVKQARDRQLENLSRNRKKKN